MFRLYSKHSSFLSYLSSAPSIFFHFIEYKSAVELLFNSYFTVSKPFTIPPAGGFGFSICSLTLAILCAYMCMHIYVCLGVYVLVCTPSVCVLGGGGMLLHIWRPEEELDILLY